MFVVWPDGLHFPAPEELNVSQPDSKNRGLKRLDY
jgi:hypothetical protein